MRNFFYLVLVLALFVGTIQAEELTKSQEQRLLELERICQQQEQKIQQLQNKLQTPQQSREYTEQIVKEYLAQPQAEEAQGITAGYDNGFFVRGADGNMELKINGFIQAGMGIHENNSPDNNTIYLNGAVLMFDVKIMKDWQALLVYDFQGGGNLLDAYVAYRGMPEFNVVAGHVTVPFTIQNDYYAHQGISIFGDPLNSWDPGYDAGMMIEGVVSDMIQYKIGLFNGEGGGGNNTDDLRVAGQLRIFPMKYSENSKTFLNVALMHDRNSGAANNTDAYFSKPWGPEIFGSADNTASGFGDGQTRGTQTSLTAGFKYENDMEGGHNLRTEFEFVYHIWQRDAVGAHATPLLGYGISWAITYRHCLNPEVEGSGVFPMFKISWTDIDNKAAENNYADDIPGATVMTYTLGIGYAFNKHIRANLNWMILENTYKNRSVNPAKDNLGGNLEQAWYFQVTADF